MLPAPISSAGGTYGREREERVRLGRLIRLVGKGREGKCFRYTW